MQPPLGAQILGGVIWGVVYGGGLGIIALLDRGTGLRLFSSHADICQFSFLPVGKLSCPEAVRVPWKNDQDPQNMSTSNWPRFLPLKSVIC